MKKRERYHGWNIAWALAVTQTVSFGILFYAYSVFTIPMETEFGWTRAQTSGAFSLALFLSGVFAFPIGRWVDLRGARLPMSAGSVLASVLVFAWSYIDSLVGLYVVQALIGLAMGAILYDVAFTVIARWFLRHRIQAMLIVTSVAGLASTIFIPLTTVLVEWAGWQDALRILAVILAVTTVPLHALVVRDRPAAAGGDSGSSDGEEAESHVPTHGALRSLLFWRLTAGFSFDRIVTVALAAHSVPLLLERGHSAGLVAAATGSIGLLQVVGRLLFGPGARYLSLPQLTSLTFAVRVASLLVLAAVPGVLGVWAFAVLFGLSNGATTLARAGIVGAAFGSRNYGAINGGMSTVIAVAQTVAPLSVGALRVAFGGYTVALVALGVIALLSLLSVGGMQLPAARAQAGAGRVTP